MDWKWIKTTLFSVCDCKIFSTFSNAFTCSHPLAFKTCMFLETKTFRQPQKATTYTLHVYYIMNSMCSLSRGRECLWKMFGLGKWQGLGRELELLSPSHTARTPPHLGIQFQQLLWENQIGKTLPSSLAEFFSEVQGCHLGLQQERRKLFSTNRNLCYQWKFIAGFKHLILWWKPREKHYDTVLLVTTLKWKGLGNKI